MKCQLPKCSTPTDDVKRVWITVGARRYRIDMCADDRAGLLDDVLRWAQPAKPEVPTGRKSRRIVVTDPAQTKEGPPNR